MRTSMVVLLSLAVATFGALPTDALPRYADKLPNGGAKKFPYALGHNLGKENKDEPGKLNLNAFGRAFALAGYRWTTELCSADSDGDGQTNGQELGDPCCSWIETQNLAYIDYISNPMDNTSTVNPAFFQGITCTKSEAAVEAADEKAKKAKKTLKPKKTTKPPTLDDWEGDYDASTSGSSMRKTRQDSNGPGKIGSAATSHRTAATTATLISVVLTIAWTLL